MFDYIIQSLSHHPYLGIVFAFSLAMLESLPLLGSLVPGMITMPPIGWLMATSILPMKITFICIFIGGMIGDCLGYALGLLFRDKVKNLALSYRKSIWIEQGESFVRKHGALSILIGRFIGPMRSSVPLFAGLLNMNQFFFIQAAIPTVLLWAFIHLAPGFIVAWMDIPVEDVLSMMSYLIYLGPALIWLLIFIQPTSNLGNQQKQQALALYLKLSVFVGIGFGLIGSIYYHLDHPMIIQLNQWSKASFMACQTPWTIKVCKWIKNVNHPLLVLNISLIFASALWYTNRYKHACDWLFSSVLAFFICFLIKQLSGIARPHQTALVDLGQLYSFPSGHTTMASVCIPLLVRTFEGNRLTRLMLWCLLIVVVLSRLILAEHWLTDVVAGLLLGLTVQKTSQVLTSFSQERTINTPSSIANCY